MGMGILLWYKKYKLVKIALKPLSLRKINILKRNQFSLKKIQICYFSVFLIFPIKRLTLNIKMDKYQFQTIKTLISKFVWIFL